MPLLKLHLDQGVLSDFKVEKRNYVYYSETLGNTDIRIENDRRFYLGPPTLHELPPMQQFMVVFKIKDLFLQGKDYVSHLKLQQE